jgi:soluble lytic murein transglycosylase
MERVERLAPFVNEWNSNSATGQNFSSANDGKCCLLCCLKHLRKIVLLAAVGMIAFWGWLHWREHRFDSDIAAAARRYDLDPALIRAVIWEESRFDPDARGRAGEMGLMQVREPAAREWAAAEHIKSFNPGDCFAPGKNVLAGAYYLKKVLRRYTRADDPVPYALAEYNAGRGNVLKWLSGGAATNSAVFIGQIGFPGTKAYVTAIMDRREYYAKR